MSRTRFDEGLPINARRDEIQAAVERHPVVIVCGETGSGKTTQLPKMLLEMGRGKSGRIGHSQPRRIAARSVAARIADELGTELGGVVGCKVRFHDQVGSRTAIKLMTDGILLAETQGDRELREYDSIILDEAHERSLNIDFLLGYMKRLVARRPELRVVVTSATIDAERFWRHCDGARVIEVSGRLYPVEMRYRPVGGDSEDTTRDEEEAALAEAVDELCREGPGDVLVFLPGEREIRDAADTLRRRGPRNLEILPLYARLSAAEQDRVFKPAGARRVVLATNVAETSLTVPRIRYVVDTGYALLGELGAVDDANELTGIGAELARLPLDPRIGRMLVAAREERCLAQMRIIAGALSVQDPRERPLDRQAAADERHARFADERSDFLGFLKLAQLFENKMERACRENFLSIPRMREWRDVTAQLARTLRELDWPESSVNPVRPEGYRAIHRALTAGLLGNVGMRDEQEGNSYTGARGIKFWIHPGSWAKKAGRWVAAGELVETTRLFARTVAAIEPRWLEEIGAHLIKRERHDPQWDARRGEVMALERGSLYGLPVYANRRVSYGRLDPQGARQIFIREALVHGALETRAPFLAHNRRLVAEIERLEHKSPRPDILVDEELIPAFYDQRVPAHVYTASAFEQWRVHAEREHRRLLNLSREDLMRHEAAGVTTENFPPQLELGPNRFPLEYHFEPGSPRDGVTLTVPLALLNQVPVARTEWLVAELLKEKLRVLAKAIPQRLRHKLGPLDEFVAAFCDAVAPSDTPLATALARYIRAQFNLDVPLDAFRPDSVPPHLRMNFRVVDETGRQRAMDRDLAEIKRALGGEAKAVLQQEAPLDEGTRYTGWTMGELPEIMEIARGGHTLVGYPALVDPGDAVTLQVFESPEKAREAHAGGVRRWLARTPWERLQHLPRYLKAAALRLEKLRTDPQRDQRLAAEVAALEQPFRRELVAHIRNGAVSPELDQFGWLLEELRVSLFAQELRTPVPVSAKRLAKLWQRVRR